MPEAAFCPNEHLRRGIQPERYTSCLFCQRQLERASSRAKLERVPVQIRQRRTTPGGPAASGDGGGDGIVGPREFAIEALERPADQPRVHSSEFYVLSFEFGARAKSNSKLKT